MEAIKLCSFFFQAEDGIRDAQESRGLGDVYKRQGCRFANKSLNEVIRNTTHSFVATVLLISLGVIAAVSYTHLTLPTKRIV